MKTCSPLNKSCSTALYIAAGCFMLTLAGCGGGSSSSGNKPSIPKSYSIVDLGTLPGGTSIAANALNNKGQVVGLSFLGANPPYHAVLFSNGTVTDLGTLPGGSYSTATGINDQGQICGTSDTGVRDSNGNLISLAFLYSSGAMTALGSLPGDFESSGDAINSQGQVAGSSYTFVAQPPNSYDITPRHAALFSGGAVSTLGIFPGDIAITPAGINARGQIVGYSINASKVSQAFLYSNGQLTSLGRLPGDASSAAAAINAQSQIVGSSATATATSNIGQPVYVNHAVLFSNGQVISLGQLPGDTESVATAINDQGQIIGVSNPGTADPTMQHPFLYSEGTMVDLNSRLPSGSGWILTDVTGINNTGQICGNGTHSGQNRAFLMTPQ